MSCIIAAVDGQRILMASDSMAIRDEAIKFVAGFPKVFHREEFLFGCCGCPRQNNLLRFTFQIPPHYLEISDPDAYMAGPFIEAVRECFCNHGFAQIHNGQEFGGHSVVGYRGRLYEFGGDFTIEPIREFTAIGCGSTFALAAMRALEDRPIEDRLIRALEIAGEFDPHVGPPYYIERKMKEFTPTLQVVSTPLQAGGQVRINGQPWVPNGHIFGTPPQE